MSFYVVKNCFEERHLDVDGVGAGDQDVRPLHWGEAQPGQQSSTQGPIWTGKRHYDLLYLEFNVLALNVFG